MVMGPFSQELTILKSSVTLNNDQIKTLPTTPVVVVPPTETLNYSGVPTQLFVPLLAIVRVVSHAVDYGNINASCFFGVNFGSDNSFNYSSQSIAGDAANVINTLGGIGFFTPRTRAAAVAGDFNLAFVNTIADALLDNAVVFFAFNQGDGNFTGGDDANEIKLTVAYVSVDI